MVAAGTPSSAPSRAVPVPWRTDAAAVGWNAAAWEDALEEYYDEIGTGPDARGPAMLVIEEGKSAWTVRQIFGDPCGRSRLGHLRDGWPGRLG
jgi:hypothetical protein